MIAVPASVPWTPSDPFNDPGSLETSLDAKRAKECCSAWNEVFQHAQNEDRSSRQSHSLRERVLGVDSKDLRLACRLRQPQLDLGDPGKPCATGRGSEQTREHTDFGVISRNAATLTADVESAAVNLPALASNITARLSHDVGRRPAETTHTLRPRCVPLSDCQVDSINVAVHNGDVSIAVRDSVISEHAAVHCAFETAQKLTGMRGSLQRLTLNGRVLYQTEISDSMDIAVRRSAFAFTC
jgi:hypothetical protein